MVTIIQATNRPDSNTEFISKHVQEILEDLGQKPVGYISMVDVFPHLFSNGQYKKHEIPEALRQIQDEWLIPAEKFVWILPEYNGSFPGVLKLFIDTISVRKYEETFMWKKSMLIGVATGRSGNIRGIDHMTGILNHMKSIVYPRLLPVSRVNDLVDDQGRIHHEPTLRTLEDHLKGFVFF